MTASRYDLAVSTIETIPTPDSSKEFRAVIVCDEGVLNLAFAGAGWAFSRIMKEIKKDGKAVGIIIFPDGHRVQKIGHVGKWHGVNPDGSRAAGAVVPAIYGTTGLKHG